MKKGDRIEHLRIDTMAAEGKCVGRHEGKVVFIQGGAPGDVVTVSVTKIKSSFLEAKVETVEERSPFRADPFCEHFGLCGGCSWQHIQYEQQLQYKQQQVIDNLERLGGLALPPVQPIIASRQTKHYRNKLDFTFTANKWLTSLAQSPTGERVQLPYEEIVGLGYHMPRMYDRVFDVANCYLQADPSNAIRLLARKTAIENQIPFFDLRKQVGFLRTLTIRTASTGETMVILQVTYDELRWIDTMLGALTEAFPQITSAHYIINGKRNDTFHDLDIVCWKGQPYITETMPAPDDKNKLAFRVGPKSFYQTNSAQAYELYLAAWKMAALTGHEHVYDLYTGTGTIANFVARHAKKVIGLEYVEAAIEDAKINSQINGIGNTEFYAGDMKDILTDAFLQQHGPADVIITDPPRAGMHADVCQTLLRAAPERIIYVSCNPATQARDLQLLAPAYHLTAVQPVDMFPHTMHVENIVRLDKRG